MVTLKSISASAAVQSVWRCCTVPVSALAQVRPSRSRTGYPFGASCLFSKKYISLGRNHNTVIGFKKKKKDDYNFAETGDGKVTP